MFRRTDNAQYAAPSPNAVEHAPPRSLTTVLSTPHHNLRRASVAHLLKIAAEALASTTRRRESGSSSSIAYRSCVTDMGKGKSEKRAGSNTTAPDDGYGGESLIYAGSATEPLKKRGIIATVAIAETLSVL